MAEPLQILWPEYSSRPVLHRDEIHLWAVRLDSAPEISFDLLSRDEKERAARFYFALHRRRFICGRGALRQLFGHYTNTPPQDLAFCYGPNGKPALDYRLDGARTALSALMNSYPGNTRTRPYLSSSTEVHDSPTDTLHFNVAHCDDVALIAIGYFPEIGVDVEKVRWLDDFDELVSRFFSERESHCFQNLDSAAKPAAFFNLWTRKEALLKATGEGICNWLNRVEVTFLPNEPARLLALPDNREASAWSLRTLEPVPGYTAALAVKGRTVRLKCYKFVPRNCDAVDSIGQEKLPITIQK